MKELLYEPYSISVEVMNHYPKRIKKNTFFELVYILAGTGTQCVNDNTLNYRPGDMFLMSPSDFHDFKIETTTEFFFLRFNDLYLKTNGIIKDNIQRLEYLLYSSKQVPGSLLRNETDKSLVEEMLNAMIREQINRDTCWDRLTLAMVNALIVIVARNIAKHLPEQYEEDKEDKIINILQYIHANIYDPKLIRVEHISKEFDISISYLGRYFKKHSGKTLQDYITNYKLKLIENRLLYSKMRISEIAEELGFADESHFNKFFRKQKGVNPSDFRNI
jgi:AraC-like DNA-binding protein